MIQFTKVKSAAKVASAFTLALGITACTSLPTGPSVMALPGTGQNFDQFRADDGECRQYAMYAIGGSPQNTASNNAVNSAAVGTAVGAAAGALIGAASGNPGAGAAIGAGSGLIIGSASGADAYGYSGYEMQDRFDQSYVQCMYAKGHRVPVPAAMANAQSPSLSAPMNTPPPPQTGAPYGGSPAPAIPPPGTPPPRL
jgi:hypothetical protein